MALIKSFDKFNSDIQEDSSDNLKKTVAAYHWGKYAKDMEVDVKDFDVMVELSPDDLAGFDVRDEDQGKKFYAEVRDIDTDDEGTSVKHAYAVETSLDEETAEEFWKNAKEYRKKVDTIIPLNDDSEIGKFATEITKKYKLKPDPVFALTYQMLVDINYHDMAKEFVELAKKHR